MVPNFWATLYTRMGAAKINNSALISLAEHRYSTRLCRGEVQWML